MIPPQSPATPAVSAAELRGLLRSGDEVAVIDLRDTLDLIEDGALLLAVPVPLGQLAAKIRLLVPHPDTRIILLDGAGSDDPAGLAQRGLRLLRHLGYRNLGWLAGGVAGWKAAGLATYDSSYIFGLAFATFLEQQDPSPFVSAPELRAWLDSDSPPILLDTRNPAEFAQRSIAGAVQATGADTLRLSFGGLSDPARPVVVTCAGYTRSITAAQGLRQAGLPNPVHILRDGTKAWQLAGFPFRSAAANPLGDAGADAAPQRQAAVARLVRRFGFGLGGPEDLDRLAHGPGPLNRYFLDIRTAQEFAAAHVPGFRNVPHDDIWPWTLRHVAALHSRIVLADGAEGLRGAGIAAWLRQQGWQDVTVIRLNPDTIGATAVPAPSRTDAPTATAPTATPAEVAAGEWLIADLSPSAVFAREHLPGARSVTQAGLPGLIAANPGRPVALVAETDATAELAWLDVSGLDARDLRVLTGGTAGWRAAGLPVETGLGDPPQQVRDAQSEKWDAPDWRARFVALMEWEHRLPEQIAQDDTLPFRHFPIPAEE